MCIPVPYGFWHDASGTGAKQGCNSRAVVLSMSLMAVGALVVIALATVLLIHHLWIRPALDGPTRLRLLFGLGVLPAAATVMTTAQGLTHTTERNFCGSCHVMAAHLADVEDAESESLAARHGRNPYFGDTNCYTCHADYGMLGYPLTKLNGLRHVYHYYLGGYRSMSAEEARTTIRVAKPYPNSNCTQCHSGTLASFRNVGEHQALADDLAANRVACASAGCHGFSHPFTKTEEEKLAKTGEERRR